MFHKSYLSSDNIALKSITCTANCSIQNNSEAHYTGFLTTNISFREDFFPLQMMKQIHIKLFGNKHFVEVKIRGHWVKSG